MYRRSRYEVSTPATKQSVRTLKTIPYRGTVRPWSNRYYFSGPVVSTSGDWAGLADAIIALERAFLAPTIEVLGAAGYDPGSDVPVWEGGATGPGLYVPATGDQEQAGDVVGLVRYTTDVRTSFNHPVYLFNYYHGAYHNSSDAADVISGPWYAKMLLLATAMHTGITTSLGTFFKAGPRGAVAQGGGPQQYLTHRDFPN